jgi:four helix bundle protein
VGHANSFTELEVYKLARILQKEVYKLSQSFPKEEMFSLTDQIRRSPRAIGAQIAGAWAKRRYKKHFVSKLTDSDGEQLETQHWILTALDCRLLNYETAQNLLERYQIVGRQL